MTGTDSSDWLGLSGRVCVVTGGGGGIGRATAVSLAQAGARVAAIDRDERGLEGTQAELRKLGDGHIVIRCDTTSAESVTAASEAIAINPQAIAINDRARKAWMDAGGELISLSDDERLAMLRILASVGEDVSSTRPKLNAAYRTVMEAAR